MNYCILLLLLSSLYYLQGELFLIENRRFAVVICSESPLKYAIIKYSYEPKIVEDFEEKNDECNVEWSGAYVAFKSLCHVVGYLERDDFVVNGIILIERLECLLYSLSRKELNSLEVLPFFSMIKKLTRKAKRFNRLENSHLPAFYLNFMLKAFIWDLKRVLKSVFYTIFENLTPKIVDLTDRTMCCICCETKNLYLYFCGKSACSGCIFKSFLVTDRCPFCRVDIDDCLTCLKK